MSWLIVSDVTLIVLTILEWYLAIVYTKVSCSEDVFDVLCLAVNTLTVLIHQYKVQALHCAHALGQMLITR